MTSLKNRIVSSAVRHKGLATAAMIGFLLLVGSLIFFHRSPPQHIAQKIGELAPQVVADVRQRLAFSLTPSQQVKNKPGGTSAAVELLPTAKATGPLRVSAANPRYFEDGSGKIIYLTGSHTWSNLIDNGASNPPPAFNYTQYLDFLTANNHNFFRLWAWEQARWTVETDNENYRFSPMPFQRTGPGVALDGLPKFDLTKFNQTYFDRLRARIIQAGDRGIYVSIMLFDGWSIEYPKGNFADNNPWIGHPFNSSNNINGINGDPNHNDSGEEVHTLAIQGVTNIQELYVKKVIDTVNDLDNVLYEVANESNNASESWQVHIIDFIHQYEKTKSKQHPVGMTAAWPGGWNPDLYASEAEWVSPNNGESPDEYLDSPRPADGTKVIVTDTDHLCGVCGDRIWVWKSFTRGLNVIFMDVYDGAAFGVGAEPQFNPNAPEFVSARKNMGYALNYARRMNMAAMRPLPNLCSTGFCLANPSANNAEYLVYLPHGGSATVNLSAASGDMDFEWLNPETGVITTGGLTTGGGNRSFHAPFSGDAVLYVHSSIGAEKIYLPLLMRAAQPSSFLDTFTGAPSTPTTWNPANWDIQIHSRDIDTWQNLEPMQVAHGAHCEPPPASHTWNGAYANAVFQCRDHVMTALNASGYGVIYLTPDRMIDFSTGEAVLKFDMSTLRTSNRDWVDIWITPFNENVALPFDDTSGVDLAGAPKDAVLIRMNFGDSGTFYAQVYRNFQGTDLPRASGVGYESVLTPSAQDRKTFELRISQTRIRFGMPASNLWWVNTNIPRLGWTSGIVQFGHHSYNPQKDCQNSSLACLPNTWHWDNVSLSPATAFSMIKANQSFIRNGDANQTVTFATPAPANAFLRFAGIGKIDVSLNGGAFIPAVKAQSSVATTDYHPEHFSSYWMAIPQGTQTLRLRFKNDDWYTTSYEMLARDFSIWSLSGR